MKRKIAITSITIIILLLFSGIVYSYNTPEHKFERQLKLGNKYLMEQNYKEAIIAFTKAIMIEPKSIEGRLGLATAFIATKKLDNAEKVLKEVLEIDANNLEAMEYLVEIYIEQNKIEEAEKLLQQILAIDPNKDVDVITDEINLLKQLKVSEEHYNTALKLMDDKKYIEAIGFFNKVIPKDTDRYSDSQTKSIECKNMYINENLKKAKTEAQNQNFKVAINYLDLILKLDPTNSEAQKLKIDYTESIKKQQEEEEKRQQEEKKRQEEKRRQEANQLITEDQAYTIAYKVFRHTSPEYSKISIHSMSEGIEQRNGKSYYVISMFVDHPERIETIAFYYIEQKGGKAYKLDIASNELIPLN